MSGVKPLRSVQNLRSLREKLLSNSNNNKGLIKVCCGTGCRASGGEEVLTAFSEATKSNGLDFEVKSTGCQGFCENGPLVTIEPEGIFYNRVKRLDIKKIVDFTLNRSQIIDELLYVDSVTGKPYATNQDIPFYKKQKRLVLRNCGKIDPTNIQDYIKIGGYTALETVLSESTPEEVIDAIKASGLRGRGGAGFTTGLKWELTRAAKGSEKYVICNGDEGDPGAFMDRSVMEGDPHSVLEGMIVCAYAVGDATKGFIYVRTEYPLAVNNLGVAIKQAQELGLLGKNILGTGFDFTIEIKTGAGAFVCGEETALIASLEGNRGMPRLKPPYPAQSGLWGCPTVINNVETLAAVPWIARNGWKTFADIGLGKSKGTKVFALTGKVKNTGLIEVPMGVTLREIVFDIGGGILDDKKFKAVQIGGPSGGCIPEEHLDISVDFESLQEVGSMMGSGGLVVLDDNTCMVDMAKFFLNFVQHESCGKCIPCRIGTMRMLEILERITKGEAEEEDIKNLEILARDVKIASLCGLGQTAPNPVLTTLRYFRDEYEAHIKERRCEAGVCVDLVTVSISEKLCRGCGVCVKHCPAKAIIGIPKEVYHIDTEKCIKCKQCIEHCPFEAIYVP